MRGYNPPVMFMNMESEVGSVEKDKDWREADTHPANTRVGFSPKIVHLRSSPRKNKS